VKDYQLKARNLPEKNHDIEDSQKDKEETRTAKAQTPISQFGSGYFSDKHRT
jgi:hypothetical protein